MPWFPDFVGAVELARQQARAAGQADPVGQYLKALSSSDASALESTWPGDVVVYESTVYPGVTEEVCGPLLDQGSGLKNGTDYFLGYSPERINPGDRQHRFETIRKVVAGQDARTRDIIAAVYGSVVTAGVHKAPSIKTGRSCQGDREHTARSQYRTDERAVIDFPRARYRYERRAGRSKH